MRRSQNPFGFWRFSSGFNIAAPGALQARPALRIGFPGPIGGIHIDPEPRFAGASGAVRLREAIQADLS